MLEHLDEIVQEDEGIVVGILERNPAARPRIVATQLRGEDRLPYPAGAQILTPLRSRPSAPTASSGLRSTTFRRARGARSRKRPLLFSLSVRMSTGWSTARTAFALIKFVVPSKTAPVRPLWLSK